MEVMKIVFPLLMVVGALGSLVVNIIDRGSISVSLQWLSASGLYFALTLRNIGK